MPHFLSVASLSNLAGTMCLGCLVLSGEVVPGVTCPAIRTDDGTVVALSHLPSQFEVGDRVTVTGSGYAPAATCQQQVLVVTGAEPAN